MRSMVACHRRVKVQPVQIHVSDEYVRAFARRLEEAGALHIYTGHCTGQKAWNILHEELGDKVHALSTGLVFEL